MPSTRWRFGLGCTRGVAASKACRLASEPGKFLQSCKQGCQAMARTYPTTLERMGLRTRT